MQITVTTIAPFERMGKKRKNKDNSYKAVLLPDTCNDFIVGGHKWIKKDGRVVCENCGLEKDKAGK